MIIGSETCEMQPEGGDGKDTETALKGAEPFLELPADLEVVEKALGWG